MIYNFGGYIFEFECAGIWQPVSSVTSPDVAGITGGVVTYDPPIEWTTARAQVQALVMGNWLFDQYTVTGLTFLFREDAGMVSDIINPAFGYLIPQSTPYDPPISRAAAEAAVAGAMLVQRMTGSWA